MDKDTSRRYQPVANVKIDVRDLQARTKGGIKIFIAPKLPKLDLAADAEYVANLVNVNVL